MNTQQTIKYTDDDVDRIAKVCASYPEDNGTVWLEVGPECGPPKWVRADGVEAVEDGGKNGNTKRYMDDSQ